MKETIIEIIGKIADFLKEHIGKIVIILLLLILLWLLAKFGISVIGLIGAALAAIPPFVWTIIFFAALIGIGIFIYVLINDGGVPVGTGPCVLMTYKIKKDVCVSIYCTGVCSSVRGPYPKWMGSLAPSTQDVAPCSCSVASPPGISAILAILEKAKKQVSEINLQQELKNILYEMLGKGEINDDCLKKIEKKISELQSGKEVTQEEIDEIKKLLEDCK